ncbi:MAG: Bsp6I family type II restriction endonuclease [Candidatus Saccharibacteria bacterium]|nr:Bsp6I family type II restriction endonuclease [Candidatus Saccharibacteria bacterium]
MKIEKYTVNLDGNDLVIKVAHLDQSDGQIFKELFDLWKKLNDGLKQYGRMATLPEVISEGMFCVFTGSARYQERVSGKSSVSFDAINTQNNRKEQIKASSVEEDLTSFSPNSNWDDLYFMDFYNGGKLDGSFNLYQIPDQYIRSMKVSQQQTFRDQQAQGRRPRFSITKDIIKKYDLQPIATDVRVWHSDNQKPG